MSINNKIFGSPIPKKIQKKLEARQKVAGQIAPGDSLDGTKVIDGVFPNRNGEIQADLSSRTPFVRMWTSVKLIQPGSLGEFYEEISSDEYNDFVNNSSFYSSIIGQKLSKLKTEFPKAGVLAIQDEDGKALDDGFKYKFYIVKDSDKFISDTRDQIDFTRKIYEVGDYNYQSNYGEVVPGESLPDLQTEDSNDTVSAGDTLTELFPSELEKNPLMKPQTGITKVSTETEGTLGVIKKTTVDFVVHNFYDYDRIFNKYFLRPGATIFVDFGWSSVKNLYKPENLIKDKEGLEIFLYGDTEQGDSKNGEVTKNEGDLEVLQGIVTDYNAKITQNGSVECSVTLTSANTSLLSFDTDDSVVKRVKSILERGILFLGVQSILKEQEVDGGNDLIQLLNTPNHNSDATEIQNYNENLKVIASKLLTSNDGRPQNDSVRTGIFINDFTSEDNYISFGLFEDLIINSQFGFGKDEKDINDGRGTQVKMNSSNSYITWNKQYSNGQRTMLSVSGEAPSFLYPDKWGKDLETDEAGGSYSYQKNKLPIITKYDSNTKSDVVSDYKNDSLNTDDDINKERIPLRELFINVDIIIEAFSQNDNVRKVLKQILDNLNESSMNLFKLKLTSGDINDSQIKIIDENYVGVGEENQEFDEKNFQFKIMSPNSIVKDYNLEFKLPSGNIGNMYALQGASHGDNIFSLNEGVVDTKALSQQYSDSLSIIYEPDLGSFRLKQLLDKKNESDVFNVYNQVNKLLSTDVYSSNTSNITTDIINDDDGVDTMIKGENPTNKKNDSIKKVATNSTDLIKTNIENQESVGMKVVESISDYFKVLTGVEIIKKTPRLLPYTLSLTTYGIASVQPGDTFEVDYLPKMYLDDTYLQIVKVTQDISSDGWYTSFDTQFRLKSYVASREQLPETQVRLSPNALTNIGIDRHIFLLDNNSVTNWWDDEVKLKQLLPYLTDFRIIERQGYDLVLECMTTNKIGDIVTKNGGILQHRGDLFIIDYFETNFIRYFVTGHQIQNSRRYKIINQVSRLAVYAKDVVLLPNKKYRIYVTGNRVMMLEVNDDLKKVENFFTDIDEKMTKDLEEQLAAGNQELKRLFIR